ncbi:putative fatty acyl-CoA reductase CG5065 [Rhipicephalus sanguineus]|uniref:putative fatty acyl-CoA reductase CG5065 n=1 Tax=Rhipicephalus sanguineus TaxID=34632 RepID=UPI0020C4DC50|nr:putative fatty acyl-CoA reductase CG5065 [Rhipicephalus sanguineus]
MAPEVYRRRASATAVPADRQNEACQVSEFYNDREVLITGGTGFVGKVLLEKLLRSCSGLKRVYLLMRGKKGRGPQSRLEEMFDCRVFDRLKQEQPGIFEKVTAVSGDLAQPHLGLSVSDRNTLLGNVSVVFHSGAAIKFNEPFRKAYEVNVLGTKRVMDLCRQMSNIQALVHVSTSYCNCDKLDAHEVIYPPDEELQKFIEDCQTSAPEDLTGTTKGLFGHPNTYTLSKSLAESLLIEERGHLPVVIVRPSTITASLREPLPGWVDNFSGVTGITVTVSTDRSLDYILQRRFNAYSCYRPTYVKAYHCTSGSLKQQTWGELVDAMQRAVLKYPLPNTLCYPKISVTKSHLWYDINMYCKRLVPARATDMVLQLMRREPRFVQLHEKVRKSMGAAQYFVTHGWLFRTNNIVKLMHDLSLKDKQTFNIDMRSVDWYPYWDQCLLGIRKYLFKAEDSELPKARKQLTRLYARRLSLKVLMVALACPLLATQTACDLGSTATLLCLQACEALSHIVDLPSKL